MDMKREFNEAIALGEANLSVLDLAHNFCEHLQAEPLARGELEATTGLPIGVRMFDCQYATGPRSSAMDLRYVALTFYDNNCVGCDKRKPRGLPNLLDLVRDRDAEFNRIRADDERRALAAKNALNARDAARAELRIGMSAAAAGLLDLVGRVDHENSEATGRLLIETAKTVPEHFGWQINAALKDLVKVDSEHRVTAALLTLNALATNTHDVVSLALSALGRNLGRLAAAEILAEREIEGADAGAVRAALPFLIRAATPLRDFMQPEPSRSESAAIALIRIYRAFPGHTADILRHLLNDQAKEVRIHAAQATEIIIRQEPSFAVEIASELIRSMTLPDDHYGPVGSAAHAANDAFRIAFRLRPQEIDNIMQQARLSGSAPETILGVYREVLRPDHATDQFQETKELRQLAFGRLLDAMMSPRSDDDFREAREFLEYLAERNVDLLVEFAPRLLGTLALIVSRREQLDEPLLTSPLSVVSKPPDTIALIEMDTRKSWLNRTQRELCKLMATTIGLNPSSTLPLVLDMLANLGAAHAQLRSNLVRILGQAAADRNVLPLVLPSLYSAMTDPEVVVRMEGAEAYRHVAGETPDDLPSLFHETFLCMLRDPYIAVHRAALDSLSETAIPERYRDHATAISWHLIQAHRSGTHEHALLAAMEAFCRTSRKANPRWKELLPEIVSIARKLSTFTAHSAVKSLGCSLSGFEEYADLLVDLLVDPDLYFARNDLLERLGREPLTNIVHVAQRLSEAAESDLRQGFRIRNSYEHDPVDMFMSLLSDSGAWEQAEDVARRRVEYLRGNHKSEALIRGVQGRQIAMMFSRAIAEKRLEDAEEQRELWLTHAKDSQLTQFERWFDARVEAFAQIKNSFAGQAVQSALDAASTRLEEAAAEIGDTVSGAGYHLLAVVLRALAFLVAYREGIRRAASDSDRFARAVHRAGKELLAEIGAVSESDPIRLTAELLADADEDSIERIAAVAQTAVIGLPLLARFRYSRVPPIYGRTTEQNEEVTVAFTSFRIDGKQVRENEPVEPNLLHEFDIEVVVSRWPETAGRLTLDTTTVELAETFALQSFIFERPIEDLPRYTLTGSGRLLLKAAQALGPRPLEFQYRARFEKHEGITVSVEGQRTLKLRSYDPDKTPQTGSPDADRKLLEIADVARQYPGVSDTELGHFLRIMTRTAALATQALQDAKFPGRWTESEFQTKVVEFLRGDPYIALKLQQHAESGGGKTDLTFHEIPIELKVERTGEVTCKTVMHYADQAIQYAVGNGRRFALLAVLDTSPKDAAPVLTSNDIKLQPQTGPNGDSLAAPVLVGAVIIRGNLPVPSSHSRRKKRK